LKLLGIFVFLFSASAIAASWYDDVGVREGIQQNVNTDADLLFLPASSECKVAALSALGWKVQRVSVGNQVLYAPGNPCDNSSLDESRNQGELLVQTPDGLPANRLQESLNAVLGTSAYVCAFKFRVGGSVRTATARLLSNENFYFYVGGSPFIEFTRGEYWWGGCQSGGRASCFYPRVANSTALQEFVTGRIGTECALGLQAAEYQTLRVIYGDSSFNSTFRSDEITFAPWSVLNTSASATWGNMTATDTVTDTSAITTAKLGAGGFLGISGYIGNVFGEAYLDSPVDRGENFLTVSVSLSAAAELSQRGGFAAFNVMNRRLYELGLNLTPALERLTLTSIDPARIEMTFGQRLAFQEMQSILANPVYTGYRVFVHPLSTMTLGEHIVRLLELNPRTPYAFQLYPSRMNRGHYARFVNSMLSGCR